MAAEEYDVVVIGGREAAEIGGAGTDRGVKRTVIEGTKLVDWDMFLLGVHSSRRSVRSRCGMCLDRLLVRERMAKKPNAAAILARRDSFTNNWHDSAKSVAPRGRHRSRTGARAHFGRPSHKC
jgi:hypothetical protein